MNPPRTPTAATIGHVKLIRVLENECGGSTASLAGAVGVTRQAAEKWLYQGVKPDLERAILLQDLYGIDVRDWTRPLKR